MEGPILPRLQGGPRRLPAQEYSKTTAASAIELVDKRIEMCGESGSGVGIPRQYVIWNHFDSPDYPVDGA